MTRSSGEELLELDPEIDRTFHALQRLQKKSSGVLDCSSSFEEVDMADKNRTLKELAAPDVTYQYSCISYPVMEGDFELKSGIIHLLPKFHGLAGEDPNRHLHEFHVVCSTMKPHGISEEDIKLRAFPFSLSGAAKDWLYSLLPGCITCWLDMKRMFLEKFFPASRTTTIRKSICGIQQIVGETLYDYWERFKRLCASCPQHQISDQLLVQYFYEGLLPMDRSMIDAASGGALVNKTPSQARELIANMADNSQQFGSRAIVTQGVSEAQLAITEQQGLRNTIQELTSLVRQMAINQTGHPSAISAPIMKVCGICSSPEHFTDICPSLRQDEVLAVANHEGNVSAVVLRSDKVIEDPTISVPVPDQGSSDQIIDLDSHPRRSGSSVPLPFPLRSVQPRKSVEEEKAREFQELIDLFSKVEVNVPLLMMIKQIPKYAKFLKDLCIHKKKLKGNELVSMGKTVSALIQALPQTTWCRILFVDFIHS
ncbi:uncharacterized protein LOC141812780 [Curcuma longa]|uniref:uncharacterized protein LOC141812780 n=1 Tax=Curcuma longa TaxID=136217 RepID=UPI003D9E1BA3